MTARDPLPGPVLPVPDAVPAPPGAPSAPRRATADRLRDAFLAASFTVGGLRTLLGEPAFAALGRGETVPARRAARDGSPLATLVRLFLLQDAVPSGAARAALPLDEALRDRWLLPAGDDRVRASVDVRPFAGPRGRDWWIVSDLGCAVGGAAGAAAARPAGDPTATAGATSDARAGLVLGVGGASATLAGLTVRTPVRRVLDLGTGSGIQALHATEHAERVTATDVNPRALRVAQLTLALSGAVEPDLREGSLCEPVGEDERFDLIVSNPPFVITPTSPNGLGGGAPRLLYRDGGMPGDELCRTLLRQAAGRLADGGYCQVLANWQHVAGEDWRERLTSWVPEGCDAWIVQREVQDVMAYTELWLRDAGAHRGDPEAYAAAYEDWLAGFAARRTEAVGLGWITLRRSDAARPSVTVEEWTHPVEQPLGATVAAHFARQDYLRDTDDAGLLATRFLLDDSVVQEQIGPPGAEDPEHVVLRQGRGMRRATAVDSVAAGLAGVCDGSLPAGRVLDAIAQLLGEDAVALRARMPKVIRQLVRDGFLTPAGD